jgi:hypothetical protein
MTPLSLSLPLSLQPKKKEAKKQKKWQGRVYESRNEEFLPFISLLSLSD